MPSGTPATLPAAVGCVGLACVALLVAAAPTLVGCGHTRSSAAAAWSPGAPARTASILLPARVRRLTNAEYERTISDLVGATEHVAGKLPPDVRQEGYSNNANQAVPSAWEGRLDAIARDVAHRAIAERFDALVPCARTGAPTCEAEWIAAIGRRAWRRPMAENERSLLVAAFDDAAKGDGGFASGAEAVLTALLESPSLLYVTELGSGGAEGAIVTLTPYEIASLLSYTVRGGPPDDALLAVAASGDLLSPDVREQQARRLLAVSDTRVHFRRFVLEWLEVDELADTTKDADLFPGYDDAKRRMLDETTAFADEVMVFAGGSLRALLDARFASVDPSMARFYGLATWGARASLSGTRRGGVLQQASFLSAHAHEDGTSPVKRGDFVLRRLLCDRLPRPAEVGIDTVFPPPSPTLTTRERFDAHTTDASCSGCHRKLDPLGYTFERFDATGASRSTDNGKPIDASARVELGGRALSFADSLELSEWLAHDPGAADCYMRQAFRYFTSQADARIESELLGLTRGLAPELRDNLFAALVAYVRSDLFVMREVRP
jgi:hypothetical protein